MNPAVLSLERCRHSATSWLRWLFLPLLFQTFLVVGALDPLLDAGTSVHSTSSPLCSVSGQRWANSGNSLPLSPNPNDIGFDHGHCPLCASLAYGLPITELPLPSVRPAQLLHNLRPLQQEVRTPLAFTLPLSHAPPTYS